MKFSLIQAARQAGVSKSSMHRYVKSGRLSATKLENGGYEIDASELVRVFPPGWSKKGGARSAGQHRDAVGQDGTPGGTSGETMALAAEIRLLREMLDRANLDLDRQRRDASDAIEDYRRRLDRSDEERRALNAQLLTYQPPPLAAS